MAKEYEERTRRGLKAVGSEAQGVLAAISADGTKPQTQSQHKMLTAHEVSDGHIMAVEHDNNRTARPVRALMFFWAYNLSIRAFNVLKFRPSCPAPFFFG